jgi:hypothetical protein
MLRSRQAPGRPADEARVRSPFPSRDAQVDGVGRPQRTLGTLQSWIGELPRGRFSNLP